MSGRRISGAVPEGRRASRDEPGIEPEFCTDSSQPLCAATLLERICGDPTDQLSGILHEFQGLVEPLTDVDDCDDTSVTRQQDPMLASQFNQLTDTHSRRLGSRESQGEDRLPPPSTTLGALQLIHGQKSLSTD